jgi:SAM-dependent methyltransferase
MASLVHHTACPCCGALQLNPVLSAKDFTVSGEAFAIWECAACSFRFTQDVPAEAVIGKYYQSENYISHSNTKAGLVNRLYHIVRKRTLQSKRRLVQRCTGLQQGALLDIGAGTGAFLHTMQQAGWQVTGLEPDAGACSVAESQYGLHLQSTNQLFQLPPASFHCITLWHVLEHVHNLDGYLQQLKNLLAPGGKLIVAVPNYTSKDAAVYGPYWAAWDVPRHLWHFSPQSVRALLQRHGWQLDTLHPMWFDSFYVSMLSEKYKNGKGNLLKAAWTGFVSNLGVMRNRERCSSLIYIISKASDR